MEENNKISNYIIFCLFRNGAPIDIKKTDGGKFYLEILDELLEADDELKQFLNRPISDNFDEYKAKLVKIWEPSVEETKKEFRELEKAGWLEIESLTIGKITGTAPKGFCNGEFIQKGILISPVIEINLKTVNWRLFADYIANLRDDVRTDLDGLYSVEKQKRIIIEAINEKVDTLERTSGVIIKPDEFKYTCLLSTILELELSDYIVLNNIVIVNPLNWMITKIGEIEYFDYKINISLTEKFPLSAKSTNEFKPDFKKSGDLKDIKDIICVKPGFSSNYQIIINKDYVNPIEVSAINTSWKLFLKLAEEQEIKNDKSFYDFINGRRNQLITKTGYRQTKILKVDNNNIVPNIPIQMIGEKAYKIKINKLNQ